VLCVCLLPLSLSLSVELSLLNYLSVELFGHPVDSACVCVLVGVSEREGEGYVSLCVAVAKE
jgi:hypothetical protein